MQLLVIFKFLQIDFEKGSSIEYSAQETHPLLKPFTFFGEVLNKTAQDWK